QCTEIPNPGSLKQIDAGNGLVVGLEPTGNAFMLNGDDWLYLAGDMKHVTVGPNGLWMTGNNGNLYRMIGGNLEKIEGMDPSIRLMLGGEHFMAGVTPESESMCLSSSELFNLKVNSSVSWSPVHNLVDYYSCGKKGCWGITTDHSLVFRYGIEPERCQGNSWKTISDGYTMVEVGNDGTAYAVRENGRVYYWDEITDFDAYPKETRFRGIMSKVKHLSYDLGILWLITQDDKIMRCQL
uniref:Uncharacterized protein n=1 Tax=Varanus komodoensis TaxID=61221 RepID=A0A8D2JKM3_VARKO